MGFDSTFCKGLGCAVFLRKNFLSGAGHHSCKNSSFFFMSVFCVACFILCRILFGLLLN